MARTRLSLRLDFAGGARIGPGKIALLEAIGRTGSIAAAARRLGMSYRRAWLLVDEINGILQAPAVSAATGGRRGGGARLTREGRGLVKSYRAIEKLAAASASGEFRTIAKLVGRRKRR